MKAKYIIAAMLLATTTSICAQKRLTILHTNDTHSCVLPLSKNLADTAVAGRGGFLRRIAMLKEERAKDPDLLLLTVATSHKALLTTRYSRAMWSRG